MANAKRARREGAPQQVPQPIDGEPGMVRVDVTWGTIQPISQIAGVRTVGELEVLEHLAGGGTAVDARSRDEHLRGTIEGAHNLFHEEIVERWQELDAQPPVVVFCNGPQCSQSPDAIRRLVGAGVRVQDLLYYRGGVHDWVTLGLTLTPGAAGGRT